MKPIAEHLWCELIAFILLSAPGVGLLATGWKVGLDECRNGLNTRSGDQR